MRGESDSTLVRKEACPKCGSGDNLARYSDGHAYCFGMGCGYYEKGDGEAPAPTTQRRERLMDMVTGEVKALGKRQITEATCEKFGYKVGRWSDGQPVQIAEFYKDGEHVGQHIRFPDKDFKIIGKGVTECLWGQHLWGEPGKRIVITEGEIDAMSVSQMQDNRWPVVSLPNGASGAAKAIKANIEWLSRFEEVVLMFDMDEPGREAVEACAPLFPPGKCKVAQLPLKDANEMLVAGRVKETITAIWQASTYRPDGIYEVDDIIERALQPIETGLPWCFDALTGLTYGRRFGEVYTVGAGTGTGKTDFLTQQVAKDIELGFKPAVFFLEQQPEETLARIAGKQTGVAFHVPDAGWSEQQRIDAFNALRGKFCGYDSWGATEWDVVKAKVRYLAHAGIRIFYLDHLTALADTANEKESLEQMMKELASMTNELRIIMVVVSHLSTPEGKPHEEGGRVMIKHFKGSRAIGFWSHFMFGLERNQQAEDEAERKLTTFRVLKDRKTGRATGKTFYLTYDFDRALLVETDGPDAHGFQDESTKDF